ncbi:MAG: hypothetical protein CM15mP92_0800 [Halieaceae bacterium]|nr:MAG: hypothetical protein CM15mP92_0800 [Halieaceae bacterium]
MSILLHLISTIKNITFLARMELKIYLKILILLFLVEIPIIQSLRESGDVGRPGVLQEGSELTKIFNEIPRKLLLI